MGTYPPRREGEENSRTEFDQRIANRDGGMALATPTSQQNPGKNRNIVAFCDGVVAFGTGRAWSDNRKFEGNTINHDVKEGSND